MKHDEIVQHVAVVLQSVGYEVRTEYRPAPECQQRADLVAFHPYTRRPEIVAEIKPRLDHVHKVERAIRQVTGYAAMLQAETPRATVLPVVVAEGISVDARRWRHEALVWSLLMLNPISRERIPIERDLFFNQHADAMGLVPVTFHMAEEAS